MFSSKPVLRVRKKMEARNKSIESVVEKSLKNFRKARKNGDRSVIADVMFITVFEDGNDFSNL